MPWYKASYNITKDDYVVAHLDDFPAQNTNSILDEVFVDHRTLGSPMVLIWGPSATRSGQEITSTYSQLLALRSSCIKPHAW